MPSLNAAAQNFMAVASGNITPTGELSIRAGATVLATHTLTGFSEPVNGVVTANAIADVLNTGNGVPTNATLSQSGRVLTLSVGLPGSNAEVIIGETEDETLPEYVVNGTSKITSLTITYPAS